jgi:hypothetical protein
MIAKLAYLTTPAPNVFLLNFQSEGSDAVLSVEISKAHLANILIDGTALALRDSSNRVPNPQTENANERAAGGA